jgi:cobalt-zinc-cadmium efflux system outer membrane protein
MIRWFIFFAMAHGTLLQAAAEESRPLSFAQAKALILSGNAGIRSALSDVQAANAGVAQAGVLSNPEIGVTLDRFGANEIEAFAEQTFELGGKRRLRRSAARTELDVIENNRRITRIELESEIVRRFIPIVITVKKLTLIDSTISIARSIKDQIDNRVVAGAARRTDLIRAEIEIERLALARKELIREAAHARKLFAALGGARDSALSMVEGSLDTTVAIPSLAALFKSVRESPRLAAANIELAQFEIERDLLKAGAAPDLDISAGVLRDNRENYTSPVVGVSMNVPLFNRNTAAAEQSDFKRQALILRQENGIRLLELDIQDLHSRLILIDEKISVLKTSTIPKLERVYSLIQEYYYAGYAGFLDLAASQSEMLEARMELLDIEQERAQTLADLAHMTSYSISLIN